MPREWLYILALILPLVLRLLVLNTGFVDWLWYHHYEDAYYALSTLSVQPQFIEFIGSWALPAFVITVIIYWVSEDYGDKHIPSQFMLLPIAYVPFAVIGHVLETFTFDKAILVTYPLIVMSVGYLYVLPWAFCVWAFAKLRVVI